MTRHQDKDRIRRGALMEASRLVCGGCADDLPIGSYYEDVDEWKPEPDWAKFRQPDRTYGGIITHGYDERGEPMYCRASAIRNVVALMGEET